MGEHAKSALWMVVSSVPEEDPLVVPEISIMEIGVNLRHFLLRQSQTPPKVCSYYWIDAMCINQYDMAERAQQVARMMDIYTGCCTTAVWLGDYDGHRGVDPWKIYELHEDLHPTLKTHYYQKDHLPDRPVSGWATENMYQRLHLEHKKDNHDWLAYVRFFNERTWFPRCWVFQEVLSAPLVLYMCADLVFDPDYVFSVAQFLRCTGLRLELVRKTGPKTGNMYIAPWIPLQQTARSRLQSKGIGTLAWLDKIAAVRMTDSATHRIALYSYFAYTLIEIRGSDATDKRDKIYPAYGVIRKALLALGFTPDLRVMPDYNRTVEQLYIETMAVMLTEVADLTFLSEVEDRSLRNVDVLSSWVPDFSVTRHQSPWADDLFNQYNAAQCGSPRRAARDVVITTSGIPHLILKVSLLARSSMFTIMLPSSEKFSV